MVPGSLGLAVALQLSSTVGVAPVEIVGFDDTDLPAAVAAVDKAVKDAGHEVAVGPALDEACAQDGSCVASRLEGTSLSHLVRLTAFRVGSDVEVQDTLYDQGGAVLATGKRVVTVDGFMQAPLSSEVSAVLVSTAPATDTTTTSTTTTTTSGPPAIGDLPPGAFVAAGGGLIALVGLVGFGLDAATLEDPQSRGADKERARTTGWLFLGLTAVGVGAAAGGAVWALLPDETAAAAPTAAAPAPAPAPEPAIEAPPAPAAETPPPASTDAAILDG